MKRNQTKNRLVTRTYVSATALLAVVTTGVIGVHAADDTVSRGARLPNFFSQPFLGATSANVFLWGDGPNHRIFEAVNPQFSSTWCTPRAAEDANPFVHQGKNIWAEYDTASGALLNARCSLPMVTLQETLGSQSPSYRSAATVDSADALVFVPQVMPSAPGIGTASFLAVVSEATLKQIGSVCVDPIASDYVGGQLGVLSTTPPCSLPAPSTQDVTTASTRPQPHIAAVSWDAPTDDLIVVTDGRVGTYGTPNPEKYVFPSRGPGVVVSEFHVVVGSNGTVSLDERWSYAIDTGTCTSGLFEQLTTEPSAVRSQSAHDPAVFVPCVWDPDPGSTDTLEAGQYSIVKVPLSQQCDGYACPGSAPSVTVTHSPVATSGFLFDPVGERGFLPAAIDADVTKGLPLYVYDASGREPQMSTHITVGGSNSNGGTEMALDERTGRVYVMDQQPKGYGLTLIDARRTPISVGVSLPQIQAPRGGMPGVVPVLPPDAAHNTTWLALPWGTSAAGTDWITSLLDGIPVGSDPPVSPVDQGNTDNTTIPTAGTTMLRSYGANAGGYASHVALVGGYGAITRGMEDAGGITFGSVRSNDPSQYAPGSERALDLLDANIEQLSLDNGNRTGVASVLTDGNGEATHQYGVCSDTGTPGNCLSPCFSYSIFLQGQQCQSAIPVTPHAPETAHQDWLAPSAACSNPGTSTEASQPGLDTRSPYASNSDTPPDPSTLPATDQSWEANGGRLTSTAHSHVKCNGSNGGVSGDVVSPSFNAQGGPSLQGSTINVGTGTIQALLAPPASTLGSPTTSSVDTTAHAFSVNLGSVQISIGSVEQKASAFAGGRNGTAGTTRTMVVRDIVITNQGTTQRYCGGTDPQCTFGSAQMEQALAALNQAAPTRFAVLAPAPAAPFGTGSDGAPNGSPGGYTAAVTSSPAELFGDETFNGMSSVEASSLPGLRVIVYQDSSSQVAREIVDLAGVEADVHLGVQFDQAGNEPPPTTPPTIEQAAQAAGVPPSVLTRTVVKHDGKTTREFIPSAMGPLAIVQRVLAALDWFKRSPGEALEMAGLLALFGVPVLQMARRRHWTSRLLGER
jgi:hypothetical protein